MFRWLASFWKLDLGGGGGGGNTTSTNTTKTTNEVPAYAQPYATDLLNRGASLSNSPYQAYTGQQIAPLSQETQTGLSMLTNRAQAGSPAVTAAQNEVAKTAGGGYLDVANNPQFASAIRQATGAANKSFSGAPGAFGGSANQEITDRAASDTAGSLYNSERQRQLTAASMAPSVAAPDYQDINAQLQAGDITGQRSQDILNTQYQNWLAQMQWPYNQLDVLSNALAGSTGGRSTVTSQYPAPYQYSPVASGLGGGILGGLGGQALSSAYPNAAASSAYPWLGAGLGAALGAFG